MATLMFYHNQRYIRALECVLMFLGAHRRNNIPLVQRRETHSSHGSHAAQYALHMHVRQSRYSEEAKSNKSRTDS